MKGVNIWYRKKILKITLDITRVNKTSYIEVRRKELKMKKNLLLGTIFLFGLFFSTLSIVNGLTWNIHFLKIVLSLQEA